MSQTFLQINPTDNLLVALQDLPKGTIINHNGNEIALQDDIAAKHKFTTEAISKEGKAFMYGVLVGLASQDIPKGGLIHTFNLHHASTDFVGKQQEYHWTAPDVSKYKNRTFNGYHRADGQVGTQNYWLVIPLVFCENRNIELLKNAFLNGLGFQKMDPFTQKVQQLGQQLAQGKALEIDTASSASILVHKSSQFPQVDGIKFLTHESGCGENKDDSLSLCALLAGYCLNPNVGGITVLSLGCQHSQIEVFKEKLFEKDLNFSKPLYIFEQQQDNGSGVENMLNEVILQTFKGLVEINQQTRQPAPLSALRVGVKCGGSDGFSGISANPAIGHTADLVVGLGVTKKGLNLVCTPGNDVLATTGIAGAGATIQLFTTGLGTPTGNPISPMVKLSTNTKLADKLPEIIDINCGPIISGEKTVEQMGEEVLEYIIKLASGEINTKAMDLGQDDFMFWRRGVSL